MWNQEYKCASFPNHSAAQLQCSKTLSLTMHGRSGSLTNFHVDHKVPLQLNGLDVEANLQALCPNCHAAKTQFENSRIKELEKLPRLPFRK